MLSMLLFCLGFFIGPSFAEDCPAGKTRDGCAPGTRDQIGCCPIPKKSSWGKAASSSGCKSGLVVEDGYCCWPGQGWGGSCIGDPECPSGLVASGSQCVEPGCPSGKVKVKGNCCWPGQVWSNSGGKCVGTPKCSERIGNDCVVTIDINTAPAADLTHFRSIGPISAQRIIEYRQQVRKFNSCNELVNVRGIGPKTLEAILQTRNIPCVASP